MRTLTRVLLLVCVAGFGVSPLLAQGADADDLLLDGEPLYRGFERAGERFGVRVYYHPDDVPLYTAYATAPDGETLLEVLARLTGGTDLLIVKYAPAVYVVAPAARQDRAYADDVVDGWRSGRYRSLDDPVRPLLRERVGSGPPPAAGDTATVRVTGQVRDAETGEALIGATLFDPARGVGTATDLDGGFALRLPRGAHRLELRLIGYEAQPLALDVLGEGPPLALRLYPLVTGLEEVVVTARSAGEVQREAAAGLKRLDARALELLPGLAGGVDVLQAITTQPGVAAATEGASGVSVRGGGLDQNLVRQAGMQLLYPAHALGFFPVFHPGLVGGVELYTGYVPAALGGRVASVIDVDWRTGDFERWHLGGSAGAYAAALAVDGPLVRDRVSLLVGGRTSYVNYLLPLADDFEVKRSAVGFRDLGARLTGRWRGGRVDVFGTYAADDFRYALDAAYDYVNAGARVSLRQRLRAGLYLRAEAGRSAYDATRRTLAESATPAAFATGLWADRAAVSVRRDFAAGSGEATRSVEAGIDVTRYDFRGRTQVPAPGSEARAYRYDDTGLTSAALYGSGEYATADERWTLKGGLRLVRYAAALPAGTRRRYDGPAGLERVVAVEEGAPAASEPVALRLEPRASVTYAPAGRRYTLGLYYSSLSQGVHTLSPTTSPTPLDVLLPSGPDVPLTRAHMLGASFGVPARRGERKLGYELSAYVRRSTGVNVARQGALLAASAFPSEGVYSADGLALGGECVVRYAGLRTRVELSYGYGRSFLAADRRYAEVALYRGERLRAPTDLPHQASVQYAYEPTSRSAVTAGFTFVSGRPFTASDGLYPVQGQSVPLFGQYNAARLPPTHRLNVGLKIDNTQSRRRGLRVGFDLSAYNVYQRQNPFLAYYRFAGGRPRAFQLALLGHIIPAININVQWD